MRNYNRSNDTIVRDAKPVAFMDTTNVHNGEKPDFIFPVGNDIWTAPFDEFMDSGFADEYVIKPINSSIFPTRGDNRIAFDYFYNGCDSGEYGEPMEPFEDRHRRSHYATLFQYVIGHEIVFKGVDA